MKIVIVAITVSSVIKQAILLLMMLKILQTDSNPTKYFFILLINLIPLNIHIILNAHYAFNSLVTFKVFAIFKDRKVFIKLKVTSTIKLITTRKKSKQFHVSLK